MKHLASTLFVGLLLVLTYDSAFAGYPSLKETSGKTTVGGQNEKSGHIWFSPKGAAAKNPTGTEKMDATHRGKAGIIGDFGYDCQRRMQAQRLHKGTRAGIDVSDPCPDPQYVPTPDIKAPPMR